MTKKEKREFIFNKYGGKCSYCGDPLKKGWHVDEILPVRRNHKYNSEKRRWELDKDDPYYHPERMNLDNQTPSCPGCNINKHSMSLEEFRSLIEGFLNSLNQRSVQYKIAKRYGMIEEKFKPVVFYFEKQKRK